MNTMRIASSLCKSQPFFICTKVRSLQSPRSCQGFRASPWAPPSHTAVSTSSLDRGSCPESRQKHRLVDTSPHIISVRCWLFALACSRKRGSISLFGLGFLHNQPHHFTPLLGKDCGLDGSCTSASLWKRTVLVKLNRHGGLGSTELINSRFMPKLSRNWLNHI